MNRPAGVYDRLITRLVSFLTPISPVLASRILYRQKTGQRLNLKRPAAYNEIIHYLKLYHETPLMIRCGDKYTVRGYVQEKGCAEILNELYGVYDSPDAIDFSLLPQHFVFKVSNACGYNLFCDKRVLDEHQVRKQLSKWLRRPFGRATAEPHYAKMRPRIICERILADAETAMPNDYRVHCLNGVPVYIAATRPRDAAPYRVLRFDFERNVINIPGEKPPDAGMLRMMPDDQRLAQLHAYAKTLSEGIPLVRIDFYLVDNRVYLSEMTFTPGAGLLPGADSVFRLPPYSGYLDGIC